MNRLDEVAKRKPFAAWDLVVYAAIALLVIGLFLAVFLTRGGAAEGVRVYCGEDLLYTYTFGEGGQIAEKGEGRVETREENGALLVRIREESGAGFNELEIDPSARTVRMRDANCSSGKDCTHMRAIASSDGAILCIPHDLRVLGFGGEDYYRVTTG